MKIIETRPDTPDALLIMEELSQSLESITGCSGENSFNPGDVCVPRSLFVIAYDESEKAIGCGAIRPYNEYIAEVKRMFAKTREAGVGTEILNYLENQAKNMGYSALWLETRLINSQAVSFYEKRGYHLIPNYGKYINRPEAVCFEKIIFAQPAGDDFLMTERLILRGIRMSDAEPLFKYRSNPEINKFQSWKPQTLEDVKEFICKKIAKVPNVPDTWYQLGIFIKENDELAGDIGIHFIGPDNMQAEIGYTLSIEHQSKGYATEAVTGVINYLFNNLQKHRITASVDPCNTKSLALLERIGMRKEAHFKKNLWFNEEWADDVVYAVLNEEWKKRS